MTVSFGTSDTSAGAPTAGRALDGELGALLKAQAPALARVCLVSGAANLLMLAPSIYMLQVYDRVLVSGNLLTLLAVSVLLLASLLVVATLETLRSRMLLGVSRRIEAGAGRRVFEAGFAASLDPAAAAGAARATTDLVTVRQFATGPGVIALLDAPWTPLYLLVLYLLHPWLAAAGLVMVAVQLALALYAQRRQSGKVSAVNEAVQREQVLMRGAAKVADTAEAMGMLPTLRRHWQHRRAHQLGFAGDLHDTVQRTSAISRYLRQAQQSLLLGAGAWLVVDGQLSVGAMVAASLLGARALAPIDALVAQWRAALSARDAYARLQSLLRAHPAATPSPRHDAPEGPVTIDAVSAFAPGRKPPILADVNLRLEPGTVTVVIGPTGSGKSTLARVLVGAWPQATGRIEIAGRPAQAWDPLLLGRLTGYLPQDLQMFDGTVADNIARFQQPDAGAVVAAAELVGVHAAVLRLPRGYDTPVGDAGHRLPAGLRQRIALARALYKTPRLLVLDEPDAHLDDAGEAALGQLLPRLASAGCIVLAVSHRPALLRHAHRLVVLEAGRIRHDGPIDQVLATLKTQAASRAAATARAAAAAAANAVARMTTR